MDTETLAMNLIVHAGNARSLAMMAIDNAKKGLPVEAAAKLAESRDAMTLAHKQQTEILEESLENLDVKTPLLMVHAQDHLMNAITVLDLAQEFCDIYEIFRRK